MRKTPSRTPRRALVLAGALAAALSPLLTRPAGAVRAADKMQPEEVIAKHLQSLGPEAARAAAHSRIAAGSSRVVFKGRSTTGAIDGQVVIGSQSTKVLLGMKFPSPDYPGERFGFDGKKFTVGYLKPGVRSTLGSFLLIHGEVFKEGLMGGTLSSAWPLLNIAERKVRLEYAGTEKIDNQPAHRLKYSPAKGSDLEISLFFDAQTFRHVRTQYDRVAGARLSAGGIDSQANQRAPRYRMTEDFSDFRQEEKLTLPHSYKLTLEIENTNGTSIQKWEMGLSQFSFDQEIDEKSYNVEAQ